MESVLNHCETCHIVSGKKKLHGDFLCTWIDLQHYRCIMTGEVFPLAWVRWLEPDSEKQISGHVQIPRWRWEARWCIESRQIWWFPRSRDDRWRKMVKVEHVKKTHCTGQIFVLVLCVVVVQLFLMNNSVDNHLQSVRLKESCPHILIVRKRIDSRVKYFLL